MVAQSPRVQMKRLGPVRLKLHGRVAPYHFRVNAVPGWCSVAVALLCLVRSRSCEVELGA